MDGWGHGSSSPSTYFGWQKAWIINTILNELIVDFLQVWDLFQKKRIFSRDETKENSSLHDIAEMIALLGPPPKHFLQRSKVASNYFDEEGQWSL